MGNSVVIGRLWTIQKPSSTRHHSMSWGRPKCDSIPRPSSASRTTCASVSAGCACRRGVDGELLDGNRLAGELAVAHLVHVRIHQPGDQGLTEAEAGLHGGD